MFKSYYTKPLLFLTSTPQNETLSSLHLHYYYSFDSALYLSFCLFSLLRSEKGPHVPSVYIWEAWLTRSCLVTHEYTKRL